ncbi:MAG: 3-ketoacyl-CoA thiolase [Bacteroidales bacterium]|nr:3-ketoacyl-CoA thiolase [Bacteroidales bacterium]
MKALRKRVFITAGYNTISLGTGRKEFNPKKDRPGLEEYISEAGKGVINQISDATLIDEAVISNFMAARYNKQANLAAFIPLIDEKLRYIPVVRVEGACGSGGLALGTAIRSILAETADIVLVVGVEVQNTVKAVYGADILAGAGWHKDRKNGHAHYFPGQFSFRAGKYFEKFGREHTRKAMARWYKNAIENARLCPTAQEYHNSMPDPEAVAMVEPNPKVFLDNLTVYDCSKVSDGASALLVVSEEGLKKLNKSYQEAVEIIGIGQAIENITQPPIEPSQLSTTKVAVEKALKMANINIQQIATVECHDCFSIAGIMAVEAMGLAPYGKGADFILEGNTSRNGRIPFNTTGGLIGWGHPVGATGVHQAVTIWEQLTGKAGDAQINIPADRPYGLTVNMGGDDKTLTSIVYKKL